MEPGCTAHMGPIWVPMWVPYKLLAGYLYLSVQFVFIGSEGV